MNAPAVIEQLRSRFGTAIGVATECRGQWGVVVDKAQIVPVCEYLRTDCAFEMLTDLSGVDNYGEDPRFAVEYTLYSFTHRYWFRLKVLVAEDDMQVDSVARVWPTSDWHEREAFDMFGIRFRNHPNLKRILMWDGYPYYPLRKDFPLAGMDAEIRDAESGAGKVEAAPMLGGPFVAGPGERPVSRREPRQYDTPAEQREKLD